MTRRPASGADLRVGDSVGPFDPASYPGPRPDGPVLVHDGRLHDVEVVDGDGGPALRSPADAAVLAPGVVRWIVAYGSNASPPRLVGKGVDRRGAVLLPAAIEGWVVAFEHRRTGYGSVPVTLVPASGVSTATWVLGLHLADTGRLDRSEGRRTADGKSDGAVEEPDDRHLAPPGAYRLGRVGRVAVGDHWELPDALAYLPGPSTAVQTDADGGWRTWPDVDQAAALAHVGAAGTTRSARPAPDVDAEIRGAWPATPLARGQPAPVRRHPDAAGGHHRPRAWGRRP